MVMTLVVDDSVAAAAQIEGGRRALGRERASAQVALHGGVQPPDMAQRPPLAGAGLHGEQVTMRAF